MIHKYVLTTMNTLSFNKLISKFSMIYFTYTPANQSDYEERILIEIQ